MSDDTIKVTDKRSSTLFASRKAFSTMTPEEQADHLITEHGFGWEYFDGQDDERVHGEDDDAVRAAFLADRLSAAAFHYGDHNGDGSVLGGDYSDSGIDATVGFHLHAAEAYFCNECHTLDPEQHEDYCTPERRERANGRRA